MCPLRKQSGFSMKESNQLITISRHVFSFCSDSATRALDSPFLFIWPFAAFLNTICFAWGDDGSNCVRNKSPFHVSTWAREHVLCSHSSRWMNSEESNSRVQMEWDDGCWLRGTIIDTFNINLSIQFWICIKALDRHKHVKCNVAYLLANASLPV